MVEKLSQRNDNYPAVKFKTEYAKRRTVQYLVSAPASCCAAVVLTPVSYATHISIIMSGFDKVWFLNHRAGLVPEDTA